MIRMDDHKLWKTEKEEFDALSVMSNISRYNTRYRIKNESVAAHSFYVTWFTSSICSQLKLGPEITQLAMECAMVHDIPEVYINDVTYDCKQLIPNLTKTLEPYEAAIVEQLSDVAALILFDPQTPEHKLICSIVKYADVVSVKQYALSEIKLGNSTFASIFEGANDRLEELSKELNKHLEEYRRTL